MGNSLVVMVVSGLLAAGTGRDFPSSPTRSSFPCLNNLEPSGGTWLPGVSMVLPSSLLGAASPAGGFSPEGSGASGGSAKGSPEILPKIPRRPLPPALLAAAIPQQPPNASSFQPVRLVDLLARPAPRSQQRELILSYWQLAGAVATVSFRKQEWAWLQSLQVLPADSAAYQAALSQATGAVQSAETALAEAQQTLAQKAGWDPKTVRPWPMDKPHIGPYATMLSSLFSGGSAPRHLRLIDKCLPLWQKAIHRHAQAIYAAEDALEAFAEAYQQGRCNLRALLWAYDRWTEQHTAFLEATFAYNSQIADFALAVAPSSASGASLVRMLILLEEGGSKRPSPSGSRTGQVGGSFEPSGSAGSGVVPATYEQPSAWGAVPAERSEGAPGSGQKSPSGGTSQPPMPSKRTPSEPLPADWPSRTAPFGGAEEPTLAPPKPSSEPDTPPASSKPSLIRPLVPLVPEGGAAESTKSAPSSEPGLPSPRGSSGADSPMVREAKRPTESSAGFSEETIALYPGLFRADTNVQVEQLAFSFHAPTHPKENVRQEKLLACLQQISAPRRRELLEAYWLLWHQWAETIASQQQQEQLQKLGELILQQVSRPLGAEGRLLWRILLLAQEAEQMEAQIRLLERQEKLAQILGQPAEENLAPATMPYTGPYNLRLEVLAPNLRARWAVRRAAGLVPLLYADLQQRAKAVVQADQLRSEWFQQYSLGQRSLDEVLTACLQQKQATSEFLQTLIDYNQAIADYVLLVVPEDLPPEQFVRTLVKEP